MTSDEKRRIIRLYEERLREFGPRTEVLGQLQVQQRLRFDALIADFDLDDASLFDFGCGFGDLSTYLLALGHSVDYEGADINPALIEAGRRLNPGANIYVRDALEEGFSRRFDYIVSSGVHNYRLASNWEFVERTFEIFAKNARRAFAVNFLSERAGADSPDLFLADPIRVLGLAYRWSDRVALRHDYMPLDFTVIVHTRREVHPVFKAYADLLGPDTASARLPALLERAGVGEAPGNGTVTKPSAGAPAS